MDRARVSKLLCEIVHLASAAILCDDEHVVRQAIGDIEETLGEIKKSTDGDVRCPRMAEPTAEELENS